MGWLKGEPPNRVLTSVMVVVATTVTVDAGAVTLHEHSKYVVCWSAAPNASRTVARTRHPLYLRTGLPEVETPKRSNSPTQWRKTMWSFGTPLAIVKRERTATRVSEEGNC